MANKKFTVRELPQQALPDLKRIAELEESLFDQFLVATTEIGPTLTPDQFASRIVQKIPALKDKGVLAMIRVIFFLYAKMIVPQCELSPQDMGRIVASSPFWATIPEFSQESKNILSNRLVRLLNNPKSIGVSSKALEVMTQHQHIFCKARILSDIRPVFADNPEMADAAVITHTLELGFHRNGQHHDFYVALDADDLKKLKMIIERAEKKHVALQSILSKSSTPYLGAREAKE
jgi:hypothetical protein